MEKPVLKRENSFHSADWPNNLVVTGNVLQATYSIKKKIKLDIQESTLTCKIYTLITWVPSCFFFFSKRMVQTSLVYFKFSELW